jgi:hypothetical protein
MDLFARTTGREIVDEGRIAVFRPQPVEAAQTAVAPPQTEPITVRP